MRAFDSAFFILMGSWCFGGSRGMWLGLRARFVGVCVGEALFCFGGISSHHPKLTQNIAASPQHPSRQLARNPGPCACPPPAYPHPLTHTHTHSYAGSVIAVSHDRYFMKRIATRVVTVEDGRLVDYEGDYEVRGVHLSLELGSQG